MRSLEEQIANKCIHFTGIMDKQCKTGIKYEDVRVDDDNGPYKFPCIKTGGECSLAQFLTYDQVKQRVDEIENKGIKVAIAMAEIKDHVAKTKVKAGKIPCQCGGELHYVVASLNGHVHAKCNSCGISFNE